MFIGPATIALREGIEAALILAIMLSYLKKTQRMDLRKYVLGGALVAILTSVLVGAVLGLVWELFEGVALTIFEGSVVLLAAILLTTMILWMWKVGASISTEIQESVETQSAIRGGLGLFVLAFALILREGVELVLFTISLAVQDAFQTYVGVMIGLAIAIVLGIGIYQGSLRVSLSGFFKWTSIFLVLFAAGMIAYGIHELQEAGLLLIGPIEVWNINPILDDKGEIGSMLKALFGYNGNPSALEIVSYIGYLLIVSLYYVLRKSNVQTKEETTPPRTFANTIQEE
ncbi:MAG: FTR1 family protein [Candidatus Thorarchaeota archaeon]